MRDREKVKLFEPRRVGKSSAAEAVMDRLRSAGLPAATVDLAGVGGAPETAELLRAQLSPGLAAAAAARRATGWLADRVQSGLEGQDKLLAGILAELAAGADGPAAVLNSVADAASSDPIAVLIDEAHHLRSWPAAEQQALREFLRTDTVVGVIVASSEASALEMLTGTGRPLQYVGQRFRLPPIDREDWEYQLPRRFAEAEVPITDDALALLLDEARGHPYCTMLLAREAARMGQTVGEVTDVIVQAALLVAAEDEAWEQSNDLD
jgi:hypothetical protein